MRTNVIAAVNGLVNGGLAVQAIRQHSTQVHDGTVLAHDARRPAQGRPLSTPHSLQRRDVGPSGCGMLTRGTRDCTRGATDPDHRATISHTGGPRTRGRLLRTAAAGCGPRRRGAARRCAPAPPPQPAPPEPCTGGGSLAAVRRVTGLPCWTLSMSRCQCHGVWEAGIRHSDAIWSHHDWCPAANAATKRTLLPVAVRDTTRCTMRLPTSHRSDVAMCRALQCAG